MDLSSVQKLGFGNRGAVLHIYGSNVLVVALLKGGGNGACAVVTAAGGHVAHAFHAVSLPLQHRGHGFFHYLSTRTNVAVCDDDLYGADVGILLDGQRGNAIAPTSKTKMAQTINRTGRLIKVSENMGR